MNKRFFVAVLALLVLTSIGAHRANAQSSCPNLAEFGARPSAPVNKSLQSQLEVTYFSSDDPNAFMSERAGINRSGSYVRLNTNEFVAKLSELKRDGVASIKKQQSVTSFLGEIATLNLERNAGKAGIINASLSSPDYIYSLDRESEINVYQGSSIDGDYYRVSLLSWFVDASAQNGGRKVVDYDANVLMQPGETAVFKLRSDYEIKRSGSARSYIAVSMRSVNSVGLASHRRR